ncbi:acetoacetate decarboxylase family protein [Rhodococcus sp. HNM0569]|uniref:acetoacetate decarboxylase family protein n=1 Tax=Rhodococcus sp. HNM0569 TaxID=2716340 RepID=UPI00146B97A0|nr:acetoacetate decarboxylase family protein [Rhodococcus sp. HNM0569]NLU82185.1 acetoacetate decarboxylase family protein [Rhodococcus sp. HNM0569]
MRRNKLIQNNSQSHTVLDRVVTTPVQIRRATSFMAGFSVPTAAVDEVVAHTGLRAAATMPGRTCAMLVFVDYLDGDLGPYNEFGVTYLVRHPTDGRRFGVLIQHLPVDGDFTLAAGRGIWGFPKTLADFDADHAARRGALTARGATIAELTVSAPFPMPARFGRTSIPAYSHLDGVTRRTEWAMSPKSMRVGLGGARLSLGEHPIADELRGLGLPKRALFGAAIDHLEMTFHDAEPVS